MADVGPFAQPLRIWLQTAPDPDVALVAAADLLSHGLEDLDLRALATDHTNAHTLLGAHALAALLEIAQSI